MSRGGFRLVSSSAPRCARHPDKRRGGVRDAGCGMVGSGSSGLETGESRTGVLTCPAVPERRRMPGQGVLASLAGQVRTPILRYPHGVKLLRRPPNFKSSSRNDQGSILILVLWVLFFLAALTVAIGTHVSSTMIAAERLWDRAVSRSLAESGAQLALAQVIGHTNVWDGIADDAWNRDESLFVGQPVGEAVCNVSFLTVEAKGSVVTNAGVIGEDGKLNVNMIVKDENMSRALANLVTAIGKRNAGQADQLVAAIQDWIDEDDEMLTVGAESGYYAGLSPSYACANGPMRTLAELRMVKGMSGSLYAQLIPYLTVYGGGNVNLNCASEPVLVALAQGCASAHHDVETCESLASKIVRFQRAGNAFQEADSSEIRDQLKEFEPLSGEEDGLFLKMMGSLTVRSTAFRGIASGVVKDGESPEVSVAFVCDAKAGQFVYWREF
jgi:type II secretory pathway component PulK